MKIYLLENHELPLIRGTALVRTGNLFDPADKVGLATITGELIRAGGTAAKTGDQIDEQLENVAASVESSIDESFGRVSFSTLKERTEEVLEVFHDVIANPAFRDNKIELIKSQLRSGISRRNNERTSQSISQREFTDRIYGENTPYGWQIQYATLDNIKRDDIVAFYQRYFFPANIILAVQGDFRDRGDEAQRSPADAVRLMEGSAAAGSAVPACAGGADARHLSGDQDGRDTDKLRARAARRHASGQRIIRRSR